MIVELFALQETRLRFSHGIRWPEIANTTGKAYSRCRQQRVGKMITKLAERETRTKEWHYSSKRASDEAL